MSWYYASEAGQTGPISEAELVTLLRNGSIDPNTLIWTNGQADWLPLSSVRPDLLTGEIAGANVPVVGGYALAGAGKDLAVQRMREGGVAGGYEAVNYAGFWIRFVAYFIDGIALQLVIFPMNYILVSNDTSQVGFAMVMGFAIQCLYFGIMHGKWGATLGKLALGLRVRNPDMTPISAGRAFGRYFALLLNSFTFGIGFIMAGLDPEKRSLHDRVASTRVVSIR